jgi:cysteine desulfurase
MNTIYLDNNSTSPLLPAVWQAMQPVFLDAPGNPSSAHSVGRRARLHLEDAREKIAALLGAFPDEVVFTSGATESNNTAILGLAGDPPALLVHSPIEHPSVAEPLAALVKQGFTQHILPVNESGVVQLNKAELLSLKPRLVCLMLANHETGAIQPVESLADVDFAVHCDAVQAVGRIGVNFHSLGVSTLSFTAHKFHGPRGIGALLIRRCVTFPPLLRGGPQQKSRRAGTEPVALAVGMATALEMAVNEMSGRLAKVRALRERLLLQLTQSVGVQLNGSGDAGVPHTLNLAFPGCKADALLMALDLAGVACSIGSACSSGSLQASAVLRAMGLAQERVDSSLRLSLSALLSEEEIDEAARRIRRVCQRVRGIK